MRKILVLCTVFGFSAAVLGQTTDTVSVSAVVTDGGPSSFSVTPAAIDFGFPLSASVADHRFETLTSLTATFFAATSPWSIEVTTANPSNAVGLVSPAGDTMAQFKFNQPNFGSGDPEINTNWTGDDAVWKGIFDIADPNDAATLGSSAIQDSSPIIFKFAVDAVGAVKTNYSTDVRFDLVIQ